MTDNSQEIRSKRAKLHVGDREIWNGHPAARISHKKKDDYITSLEFTEGVYNHPISMLTIHFKDGTVQNEKPLF